MKCKIGGGGRRWSWEKWTPPGETKIKLATATTQCAMQLVRTPPASGGHQLPGRLRPASYPVDDVHQAQIAEDVGKRG